MFNDNPQLASKTASSIPSSSSGRDGLIRLRESVLNRLSGVSHALVINDQATDEIISPATDLAASLKTTLMDLKASAMDTSGANVDYATLKHSPAYAAHRQTHLAALRQFEPQQLPSTTAARAFWINLYNALVLDAVIYFDVAESVIEGRLGILAFFRQAAYQVGGQRVSLEDIEHGILRSNRGNPYVPGNLFPSTDPRLVWSLPVDPRIHFTVPGVARSGDRLQRE